jgi:large subunit ribosomal protein L23
MAIFKSKTENKDDKKTEEKSVSAAIVYGTSAQRVLVGPRISEKAAKQSGMNKYVFNVSGKANKVEVKKAVEQVYKVKVEKVNMVRIEGKNRSFGRTKGKLSDYKKAIVTLKEGQTIESGSAK